MELSRIMSRKLVWVGLDDRVSRVRELFNEYRFHHLLVLDKHKLVGVISDRDLLKNLSPFIGRELAERSQDAALLDRRVHQIMTRKPVTATPDTAVENAVQMLVSSLVSCLPVVDEQGHAVGIVTWKDLFTALLPDLKLPPVRPEELEALQAEASSAAPSQDAEDDQALHDELDKLRKDMDDTLAFVNQAMASSLRGEQAPSPGDGKKGK